MIVRVISILKKILDFTLLFTLIMDGRLGITDFLNNLDIFYIYVHNTFNI